MAGTRSFVRFCIFVFATLQLAQPAVAHAVALQRVDAVSFSDASHGFISGGFGPPEYGMLAHTSDGGATWHPTIRNRWTQGVSASVDNASAIGVSDYYDGYAATDNAGHTWTSASPILNSSAARFADAAFLAGGRRVLVGQWQATANGDVAVLVSSIGTGVASVQYAGPVYPAPSDSEPAPTTHAQLVAVDAAPGGMAAWAVGNDWTGSAGGGTLTYAPPVICRTTNGGSTWTTQTAPKIAGAITGVSAVDAVTAFAGAGSRTLLRTLDGTTWGSLTIPRDYSAGNLGVTDVVINAIDACDADHVVLVGDGGKVAWTSNASAGTPTWSYYTLSTKAALRGVAMLDTTHWVAVGDNETIIRTGDGGAAWSGSTSIQAPSVAFGSGTFKLDGSAVAATGTASDVGVGVATVEVRVKRSDAKCWNGAAWSASDCWLPAETADEWGHWSTPSWAPDTETQSMAVTISTRATDGLGNVSAYANSLSIAPTTGALRGVVRSAGLPLAGVSVKVGARAPVLTDAGGGYFVGGVTPGACAVTFSRAGYVSATAVNVAFAAGAITSRDVALMRRPTVARSPSGSSLTYKRKKGVAAFTLSALVRDSGGVPLGGVVFYLQTSKNGKSGWKDTYRLTTNSLGKASRVFKVKKKSTVYYRWYVKASTTRISAVTSKQKVVVK